MNGRCLCRFLSAYRKGRGLEGIQFNRPTASDQVEASHSSGWDKCFITSSEERTNPMTWTSSAIMKRSRFEVRAQESFRSQFPEAITHLLFSDDTQLFVNGAQSSQTVDCIPKQL